MSCRPSLFSVQRTFLKGAAMPFDFDTWSTRIRTIRRETVVDPDDDRFLTQMEQSIANRHAPDKSDQDNLHDMWEAVASDMNVESDDDDEEATPA